MSEHSGEESAGPELLPQRLERLAREQERLFAELRSSERRYRRLARAVWQVEEEERRRLSREVHDGLGQTLTALRHLLERLAVRAEEGSEGAAPELAAGLRRAEGIAAGALADARELSRLLRPPMLDDLGLFPALRWLARNLEESAGLRVDLELPAAEEDDGAPADERLPPELETLVFRAVQEALNNVLKHAEAGRARVEVAVVGPRLRVTVRDAGAGFDPDATLSDANVGAGLRGLQDRVELLGGRCRVASAPGRGTEVTLDLPRTAPEEG